MNWMQRRRRSMMVAKKNDNNYQIIADWDFTQSLVDSVNGIEITLANSNGGASLPTRDANGLHFTAGEQIATMSSPDNIYSGKDAQPYILELSISSAQFAGDNSKHKRLLNCGITNWLIFRNAGALQTYDNAWLAYTAETGKTIPTSPNQLSGKTVSILLGNTQLEIYIDDELIAHRSPLSSNYAYKSAQIGGQLTGTASQGNDIHNMTITRFRILRKMVQS